MGHVGGWDCGWGKLVVGWGLVGGGVGGGRTSYLFACVCLIFLPENV